MRIILAVIGALCLAALDFLLVAAAFLGRPAGGEWLLLAMLAGFVAGILFRRRWLVFAAQNAITVLSVVRWAEWEGPASATDVAALLGYALLGNGLAWLVARALPQPRERTVASRPPRAPRLLSAPSGAARTHVAREGPRIDPFLRTLALVAAGTLLIVLAVFAAAQGALDGNPLTLAYWAKWWPIWLLVVPAVLAGVVGVTGRAGHSLAWSAVVVLLVGGLVLARFSTLSRTGLSASERSEMR